MSTFAAQLKRTPLTKFVVTCLTISVVLLCTTAASARIWQVQPLTKKQVLRGLAVDTSDLSLLVGFPTALERFYPNGDVKRIREHHPMRIALIANQYFIDYRMADSTITRNGVDSVSLLEPLILDDGDDSGAGVGSLQRVTIRISTLAVNRSGVLFVGGYRAEEEKHADKTFFVWELSKDTFGDWHAATLAKATEPPQLISTNTETALLLDRPQGTQQLLPAANGRLKLRPFAPTLPACTGDMGLAARHGRVAHDSDDTMLISDEQTGRVWRLSTDGKTLDHVAGTGANRTEPNNSHPTDPRLFSLKPGKIAVAPGGGIFIEDIGKAIRFIGPNDELEENLTKWLPEIEESILRNDDNNRARQNLLAIELIATNEANTMRGWRAEIALRTLFKRMTVRATNPEQIVSGKNPETTTDSPMSCAASARPESGAPALTTSKIPNRAKHSKRCPWFW